MTVRAKFLCLSKREDIENIWDAGANSSKMKNVWSYKFTAVHSGSPENTAFFSATPSGQVDLACTKSDVFEPGKEYYLDFIPAE